MTSDNNIVKDETHIVPSNIPNRAEHATQKIMSGFIDYPIKGLKGDVNSNFYEFLTMGIIPYVAGSAMFMFVFNALNLGKHLGAKDARAASNMGKKMALAVVMYGALKNLSKNLVTYPVKSMTGVDTELPYQNKVYNLPKGAGENAEMDIRWQQRKVFDSKEFFRKDLLDRKYYDKVARKLGLGEDLNDSISETTPIIQNIVATSNTAKTLSSYCWAAVGVGLAMQDSWLDFFDSISNRAKYVSKDSESFITKFGGKIKNFGKNSWDITKQFIKSTLNSFKELWIGNPARTGIRKHFGKGLIGIASLATVVLTANTVKKAKGMAKNNNVNTIDDTKESTVI